MASDRLLTEEEKAAMERLSLGILELCNQSGLGDGALIANAAIIGCAGAVAATFQDDAPVSVVAAMANRAGSALEKEIIAGHARFVADLAAYSKPKH